MKEMQMIRHLRINRSGYTVINNIKGTKRGQTLLVQAVVQLVSCLFVHAVVSFNLTPRSVIKIIILIIIIL